MSGEAASLASTARRATTNLFSALENHPPAGDRYLSRKDPLFGRLIQPGKDFLLRNGWQEIDSLDQWRQQQSEGGRRRLALIWPSKSGPQFRVDDPLAAHIRPYPTSWTEMLDNKLLLSQALRNYTTPTIAPACITFPPKEAQSDRLYFVKHRYGAQGKSVYVYNQEDLLAWWSRSQNAHDFVIQEEIIPALYNGRKFVLRCHILLLHRNLDTAVMETYLHSQAIICQHHSALYRKGLTEKSSQVSQAGKRHPSPVLLEDLETCHPAAQSYDEIKSCCASLLSAVLKHNTTTTTMTTKNMISQESTCFALLGVDLIMDEYGDVKVCEVNSHPALGWGTMAKVPSHVFSSLLEDTLAVLLNGHCDKSQTGYEFLS